MGIPQLRQRPAIASVPITACDWGAGNLATVEEGKFVRGAVVVTKAPLTVSAYHCESSSAGQVGMLEVKLCRSTEHRIVEGLKDKDLSCGVLGTINDDQSGPFSS